MAVKGIGASFKIGDAASPATLTDVSSWLNKIDGTSSPQRLDATPFQPDVASPLKVELRGFDSKGFTLGGLWNATSEAFFSALEGAEGLSYQYGPEGTTAGKKKITGLCNCISYSGPQSDVQGITTFTVELNVTSRSVGAFS